MKKGIVLKLFLLTAGLCLFLIAVIFILQTVFFKQFYVHQKMKDVNEAVQAYEQGYLNGASNTQEMARLEQDFFQKHNTWITALDTRGNIKYAGDFFMEIKLEPSEEPALSGKTIIVPLYSFINVEDFSSNKTFVTPGLKKRGRSQ